MISIIMCVYNEPDSYYKKAINSMLNQTYRDYEFIIVLDNPNELRISEILKLYAYNDKRIKLLFNDKNLGLTNSLNKALQCVKGDYVARMDADDIAEPNRLEIQIRYLQDNNLDLVGSSMRRISESGELLMKKTNPSYSSDQIAKLLMYDDCVPHPTWLVKREVYEKLNGYRDINACEDYDFLLRALKHGFHIGVCDEILLNYRVNTKGISQSNMLKQMLSADYLRKNFDRIEDINQAELNKFLNKHCTDRNKENYSIAVHYMNTILEKIKNGKKIYIVRLPFLILKSKYIMVNFFRIVQMKRIKMQIKK